MLSLFNQLLVVRCYEVVQQLSHERCQGCKFNYRFDCLHECIKTSIQERVKIFLPEAKKQVLQRMDQIMGQFQQNFPLHQPLETYLQVGEAFVHKLSPVQLTDRRFIHEGTGELFAFDLSWREDPNDLTSFCNDLFGKDATLDQTECTPKITKRKITDNGNDNDPIDIISDRPAKRQYKRRTVAAN